MNRRGFTFIEMLVVMIVMGILAGIAVLKYIDLRNHATAATIARDVETIRLGAYNHWADHENFPSEAGAGVVPAMLVSYLPQQFSFDKTRYTYDWDNFGSGGGGYQVGLTVTVSDPRLKTIVLKTFSERFPFFQHGDAVTYILVGPDGRM
jgi:prepilin-type N-terminal cleavage/methylation domain-containing protein